MKRWRVEFIAFAGALFMMLLSALWFGIRLGTVTGSPGLEPLASAVDYRPRETVDKVVFSAPKWTSPIPQARGKEWVYDIFTPPEIFYDPDTKSFRVTTREGDTEGVTQGPRDFGLELLAVTPTEFPLQLLGFIGEEGRFMGTFENKVTFETLLLATGDRVASLGLSIIELRVERIEVQIPDSMKVNEYRATAVVRRDHTGKVVTLHQGVTLYIGEPEVTVVFYEQPDIVTSAREGDTLKKGGIRYTIGKIRLAPPSVDVTKEIEGMAFTIQQTLIIKSRAAHIKPQVQSNETFRLPH